MSNKKAFIVCVTGVVTLIFICAWLRGCGDQIKTRLHKPKQFNAVAYLLTKNKEQVAAHLQAHKRDSLVTDSVEKLKRLAEIRYKKAATVVREGFTRGVCDTITTKKALNDCDTLAEQNNRVIASQKKELEDYAGAVGKLTEGQAIRDARHIEDSTSYAVLYKTADSLLTKIIPKLEKKAVRNFKLGAAAGTVFGASAGYGAGKILP